MTAGSRKAQNFKTATFVRLLAIVSAATEDRGATVSSEEIHTIAYFADVLAPVYELPVLYPQVLKSTYVAAVPDVQRHLDRLAGMGMLVISEVDYRPDGQRIIFTANYGVNVQLCGPVLEAMHRRDRTRLEIGYISELTLALLGLGTHDLWRAAEADATYGDPSVDRGTIVDLLPTELGGASRAVHFAKAFSDLSGGAALMPSEMINLYVRHLYSILVERP